MRIINERSLNLDHNVIFRGIMVLVLISVHLLLLYGIFNINFIKGIKNMLVLVLIGVVLVTLHFTIPVLMKQFRGEKKNEI
ncbi:MAG: hypothetical protein OEZ01_08185 [Candidatus Heimdallarchaeota archaeon]|nr:hypothetical protein [Candidatus Heimdallarchaeota archaeon]MDH5645971.1 hypothetical protein [Candidatus Heimdallarchaeota archaeon]